MDDYSLLGINGKRIDTVVGVSTLLTGDLVAEGSVCVEGTILGNLKCRSMVIIGLKGKVEGDVEAVSAIIGGEVRGNVKVSGLLEMLESANILGDIATSRLTVAPGAMLNGRCHMLSREEPLEQSI